MVPILFPVFRPTQSGVPGNSVASELREDAPPFSDAGAIIPSQMHLWGGV